jgi:hypothetical protein
MVKSVKHQLYCPTREEYSLQDIKLLQTIVELPLAGILRCVA